MSGWYSSFEGYSRKELRNALKRADLSIFEQVMQFLEDDPKTFGSGYAKSMMWRHIRRYDLDESHVQRLESTAIKYLERPMRPEYKRMCQTMAFLGTPLFWEEVEKQLENPNPISQLNAYCLYQYSKGLQAGEHKRLEMNLIKREIKRREWKSKNPRYGPFFYGKHVLQVVMNDSMWNDNQIIYRAPNAKDLPLIRHGGYAELASLDYSQCKADEVIKALKVILTDGSYYDVSTISAWVLIFYIFGELGNNEVIPVIEDFYDSRIANQFESAKKWLTTKAIYRALKRLGTQEALQAYTRYRPARSLTDEHMRSFTTGWLTNEESSEI
ncbi:MAG: hypothetical protein ABI690_11085 [Chloroflexota bacterium]